ncbi:MAG TPA: fructose-bisphosphate aldolase, partial [Microscillaceae bacterium]|nr:fructose-bisphosphate aldolase [Microscillaceae bacterium]
MIYLPTLDKSQKLLNDKLMTYDEIVSLLGQENEHLFTHESKTIS